MPIENITWIFMKTSLCSDFKTALALQVSRDFNAIMQFCFNFRFLMSVKQDWAWQLENGQ